MSSSIWSPLAAQLSDIFELYCAALALSYHEARNVRHLLHAGHLGPAKQQWQKLTNLPSNRNHAWREVASVMHEAKATGTVVDASQVFVRRFGVTLEDLRAMFENENWKHHRLFGGNAWGSIVSEVLALRDSLRLQDQEDISKHASLLSTARHNTGSLRDKFDELSRNA
jgi:hypothetical protein